MRFARNNKKQGCFSDFSNETKEKPFAVQKIQKLKGYLKTVGI